MMIEIKRKVESTTIEITGRLDTTTAPALDKTINEDISDVTNLVFDFKGLEYISSAGAVIVSSLPTISIMVSVSFFLISIVIVSISFRFS